MNKLLIVLVGMMVASNAGFLLNNKEWDSFKVRIGDSLIQYKILKVNQISLKWNFNFFVYTYLVEKYEKL